MLDLVGPTAIFIALATLASCSESAGAKGNSEEWKSLLLPKPHSVKILPATLKLNKDLCIIVADPPAKSASKIARMLAQEIGSLGLKANVADKPRPNELTITLDTGRRRGIASDKYCLTIGDEGVSISGGGASGTFYGTRTLLQLLQGGLASRSLPYCRIEDWPDYRYRMVHYDIAREQNANVPYLKRVIDTLSFHKINMLKLYLEGRFQFKKHPLIGPPGVLTPEQAAELDEYARSKFIELVPEVNTLGHMENILALKEYRHLAEDQNEPYEICATSPEGKKLVADLITDVTSPFKTKFLHVGGDETGQTGTCPRCAEQAKTIGKSGLYLNHFLAVHKMAKARGLRMMMWGDMLLHHKDIVDKLPKDVIIFDWHYENSTEDTVQFFKRKGFDVFVCPAMSGFSRISAPYSHATDNIFTFIGQGHRVGALGECTCAWELRLGHLFENDYFGMILSADKSWNASVELDDFNRRFCKSFYGLDDLRPLECYKLTSDGFGEIMDPAFGHYWNHQHIAYGGGLDDLVNQFGENVTEELLKKTEAREKEALKLVESLRRDVKRNKQALDFLDMPPRARANAVRQILYYKQAKALIEEVRGGGDISKLDRSEELLNKIDDGLRYLESRLQEACDRFGGSTEDLNRVAAKRRTIQERKAEIAELRKR